MNGLIAVLSSAAATVVGPEGYVVRELDGFDDDIAGWADLDLREVRAARELLTLSSERVRDSPLDFWKVDARELRLATRPFIAWGASRVLFAPARVRATQLLFLNYLSAGRLPSPLGRNAPVDVKYAVNRLRQSANRDLERFVLTSFEERGWIVRERVRATHKGLKWLPGEVDLLAADVSNRRLWVVEIKDPARAFSAREIGDEVADLHGRFWEPDGRRNHRDEVAVLAQKSAAVRDHLPEALHFLDVSTEKPEAWSVRSAMVTRELSPAAFVQRSGVLFALADQAADLLKMAALPDEGFVWMPPL